MRKFTKAAAMLCAAAMVIPSASYLQQKTAVHPSLQR